jgi:hypothetical protein
MKTAAQAMTYEVTGNKKINTKTAATTMAQTLSTTSLIWLLVKRHKVQLLAVGNIVLVLNWAFPAWPQLIATIFN